MYLTVQGLEFLRTYGIETDELTEKFARNIENEIAVFKEKKGEMSRITLLLHRYLKNMKNGEEVPLTYANTVLEVGNKGSVLKSPYFQNNEEYVLPSDAAFRLVEKLSRSVFPERYLGTNARGAIKPVIESLESLKEYVNRLDKNIGNG